MQATLSVASESAVASSRLLECLPPWSTLTASVGPSQKPAWLADTLLVSRVQFLLNVLTPCAASAPQVLCSSPTLSLCHARERPWIFRCLKMHYSCVWLGVRHRSADRMQAGAGCFG